MTTEPTRPDPADVTLLLHRVREGRTGSDEDLLAAVYDELRALARARMRRERPGHSLQATALVHEAWLRLAPDAGDWNDRNHFFGAASRAMRRILVDRYRQRRAAQRGGGAVRNELDEVDVAAPEGLDRIDLIALDEALTALEEHDPRMARIAQLRFFAGLPVEDVAEALDVSPRTVKREWAFARGWLLHRMGGEDV